MASAASAIVGQFSLSYRLPSPSHKGRSILVSLVTRKSCGNNGSRLFWSGMGRRIPDTALFSSNSDQNSEESGCTEILDEVFLPPDDVDYLLKLVAGSIGGGAAVKYGSILFPDITRPNLVKALLIISLPVLVAFIILLKESYSTKKEDFF